MPTTTYRGSCHCGAIAFEADVDLAEGTGKCNCTWYWKHRYWSVTVSPDRFRALKTGPVMKNRDGRDLIGICATCATMTYAHQPVSPWNPTEKVAISIAAFDDMPHEALLSAPVTYYDGRHDNWWNRPEEVRHL